ncbi:hypothetical protein PF008_g5521 [Phytophthora fragariae]|uniref:Uncharacterized protein n=1 Tax=Phytophthora fragariae TaxID=53985 RepID=A0A6G0S8P2_9STRA|nr:hypothetical protein PF008_g5521 [Phytophthora fragariae]
MVFSNAPLATGASFAGCCHTSTCTMVPVIPPVHQVAAIRVRNRPATLRIGQDSYQASNVMTSNDRTIPLHVVQADIQYGM